MILVVAGTGDAREAINVLAERGKDVLASVVTEYGLEQLKDLGVEILKGRMDESGFRDLIRKRNIKIVVDCTHPFALKASQNAMGACRSSNTTYYRVRREKLDYSKRYSDVEAVEVEDFTEAAERASKYGRVLLTVGSGKLEDFTDRIDDWQGRLVARILPVEQFLVRARRLGFRPDEILALKGPFSKKMNEVIIRDYDVEVLVTKASGKAGGLKEKFEAASSAGISVIVITRPELDYPRTIDGPEGLEKLMEAGKV